MAKNMIKYYQSLLDKTKNPSYIRYYKGRISKLKGGQVKQKKEVLFRRGINKVYSENLNKHFQTMSEASRYVNKANSYTRKCIIGELENKYKFKIV